MSNTNSNQSLTHTYVQIMSTNTPTFGSYVYFDLNTSNYCIHEAVIQLNLSSIGGVSPNAALMLPAFCSAFKFFTSISITNQNNVLDNIDSTYNYVLAQLYTSLEDSTFINTAAGYYNNQLARYNMSSTNSTYQIPIKSFFSQTRPELLNANSSIRVSVLLDNLINIINQGSLIGLPVVSINSASILLKVTKYSNELVQQKLMQLQRVPLMKSYNTMTYQPAVVQSGSTVATISLSNFVGMQIQAIYFIIRSSTQITKNEGLLLTNNLLNYNVISSTGETVCGGVITPQQSLYVYNRVNTLGSFSCDGLFGNIFTVFHSSDIVSTLVNNGGIYGSRLYNGSEALVLNFTSALASNFNVDIYASCSSIYKQTSNGSIIKIVV